MSINNKGGRPPLPAKMKELSGTLRPGKTDEGIQFNLITIIPKPEPWLSPKGKLNFRNMCQLLIEKQLLTDSNVALVAVMSQEYATYEDACRALKKEGYTITTESGNQHPSPWVAIRNQAMKNYKDCSNLFGLDPLSSRRIGGVRLSVERDEFEKLMQEHGEV